MTETAIFNPGMEALPYERHRSVRESSESSH